jgi:hypothetical protein
VEGFGVPPEGVAPRSWDPVPADDGGVNEGCNAELETVEAVAGANGVALWPRAR